MEVKKKEGDSEKLREVIERMSILKRSIPIVVMLLAYGVGLTLNEETGIVSADIGVPVTEESKIKEVKKGRSEVKLTSKEVEVEEKEDKKEEGELEGEKGLEEKESEGEKEVIELPEAIIPKVEVRVEADIEYIDKLVEVEAPSVGEVGVSGFKTANLGEFTVKGYCSCSKCSEGKVGGGMRAYEGVTVAVNATRIPYGTMLLIDGVGIRQTQPTGIGVGENEIKIYMKTHKEVEEFGEKKLRVAKVI